MKRLEPNRLDKRIRSYVEESINEARKKGLNTDNICIYEVDYMPMRLQHIFNELGKKGIIVLESHILNGKLILICLKVAEKDLALAPGTSSSNMKQP
jgi:hypothetical protein